MKEAFEKIKERLARAESVKLYGSKNSGNYLLPLEDALSIVSEVEAEYINKSTEHINKSSDCSSNWIPVEERLPEEKGEYLVTFQPCYWDNVQYDKIFVGIDTFRGKTTWAKKKYQRVVAWQPLPEPPKKEGN